MNYEIHFFVPGHMKRCIEPAESSVAAFDRADFLRSEPSRAVRDTVEVFEVTRRKIERPT